MYFLGLYGPAGTFCWIAVGQYSDASNIATIVYYSLSWLIILLNGYFVIKVILTLRRDFKSEEDLVKKYTNKLKLYPLVQVISFIPATVNRVYNLIDNRENFYLLLIQGIFDALTGLMFAFVFGFNYQVRKSLGDCFAGLCCKRKRVNNERDYINNPLDKARTKSLTYLDDTILTDS